MSECGLHTIKPFDVSHVQGVGAVALSEPLRLLYEGSPGFTGYCGDQFVAAAGIVIPYPGLGEGWAVVGPLAVKHRVWFHRTTLRFMVRFMKDLNLNRLQATVRADWPTGIRWAKHLGFQPETTLRKFGRNGEDMMMFSILKED